MPRKKAIRKNHKKKVAPKNKRRTAKRKTTRKKGSPTPTNKALYSRVKAAAKRKFDVYPSAYANAWLVREYIKRGGGYR